MSENNRDVDRETIWGINRKDRRWFQLMTLLGGTGGSATLVWLTLRYRANDDTPDAVAFSILLAIGASFVAAGFVAWSWLQVKEIAMPIGDWIREANEKRRQRLREEGRAEGRKEGHAAGFAEGHAQGYQIGYVDGAQGQPMQDRSDNSDESS